MASVRVFQLSRKDITEAAKRLQWTRQLPKWTVMIEGRELPVRPLVLEAAGVPPNDPTNSHQAVALLQERGFSVLYQGRPLENDAAGRTTESSMNELIQSLRGCCKGTDSLVEAREREHRMEKDRMAR
jgi:hypothetical protein